MFYDVKYQKLVLKKNIIKQKYKVHLIKLATAILSSSIFILCFILPYMLFNPKLIKFRALQESLLDVFDLELKYNFNKSHQEEENWIKTSIPGAVIYSAYFESRPETIIRYPELNDKTITWSFIKIISILPNNYEAASLKCYLKFEYLNADNQVVIESKTVPAEVEVIRETYGFEYEYTSAFVLCRLTVPSHLTYDEIYTKRHLPSFVTVGYSEKEGTGRSDKITYAKINYPSKGIAKKWNEPKGFLGVCIPVFRSFNYAQRLVEFIEYYRLMGVEKFLIYNSSVSQNVDLILQHYSNIGVINILQWRFPDILKSFKSEKRNLRINQDLLAINDCLYRSYIVEDISYIINTNFDRFIVPRKHAEVKSLILQNLDPVKYDNSVNRYASFLIKNVFFYITYNDDEKDKEIDMPYLYTQAKTRRSKTPSNPGVLSTNILRVRDVVQVGLYQVTEHLKGFENTVVDSEIALSHNYRNCDRDPEECYSKASVIDRIAHKFIKSLASQVRDTCFSIYGKDGCPYDR